MIGPVAGRASQVVARQQRCELNQTRDSHPGTSSSHLKHLIRNGHQSDVGPLLWDQLARSYRAKTAIFLDWASVHPDASHPLMIEE